MQENGRIIMDKLQEDGRMIAKSKVQDYGRMPGKDKTAGVGAGKSCGLFQGIIQILIGVTEKNRKFSGTTLSDSYFESTIYIYIYTHTHTHTHMVI
jgi:hypothetical protein